MGRRVTPSHRATLEAMLACCLAWEPSVRILGNVRADDAADAIRAALRAEADEMERAAGEITPEMVSRWMREAGFTFGIVSSTYPAELHAFATLAFSHGARRERERSSATQPCASTDLLRQVEAHGWTIDRDIEGVWQVRQPRRYGEGALIAEGVTLGDAIEAAIRARKP